MAYDVTLYDEEQENETRALATTDTVEGEIVAMSKFGDDVNKTVVYNAFNDALSLSKEAPETIALQGIILQEGIASVTKTPCINTYLIDDKGQAYFSQSAGIARSAKQILAVWGGEVSGLVVRIVEKPFGEGRTVKSLRVLD